MKFLEIFIFLYEEKILENIILYLFMARWNDSIYLSLSWGNFQQMMKFVLLAQGLKFKQYDFSNFTPFTGCFHQKGENLQSKSKSIQS